MTLKLEERVLVDGMHRVAPYLGDAFSECLRAGWLHEFSPGVYSIIGELLHYREAFDRRCANLANQLNCVSVDLPVLYSMADAQTSGFFVATPQYAQYVANGHSDKAADCLCRSAICQPIYPMLKESVLEAGDSHAYTAVGKAFRGEPSGYHTLERLREFSMRELVFLSKEVWVREALDTCRDWIELCMEELGLRGQITTATDPFFGEHVETLKQFQLAHDAKIEWRLWIPHSNHFISVASLNYHGSHFGKKFRIHIGSGLPVHSGCVGFGQERFLMAIFSQYGINSARWPSGLRKFLEA